MPDEQKFVFSIDSEREEASLTVGEQSYRIFYDIMAINIYYRAIGINPVLESIGADQMRWAALLWVGLLHDQPALAPETVNDWFTLKTMEQLVEGTWKSFKLFVPEKKKGDVSPSDPPKA